MGLIGERKAVAAAALGFFGMLFSLNALVGPPDLGWLFGGLALVYGVGFFGVVAGWFWARWYAMGLGFSGLGLAVLVAFQVGLDPVVWIWGVPHGAVLVSLIGRGPSSAFDGRVDWRERYRLDEDAAHRLGKSVVRAGASLPFLVMATLGPREGGSALVAAASLAALLLAGFGLRGLVRLRGWAPLALIGAAGAAGVALLVAVGAAGAGSLALGTGLGDARLPLAAVVTLAGLMLVGASAPFIRPLARHLRGR